MGYSYDPLFVLVTDGLEPFAAAIRYDAYVALFCGVGSSVREGGRCPELRNFGAPLTFRRGRFLSRNQVSGRSMRGRVD